MRVRRRRKRRQREMKKGGKVVNKIEVRIDMLLGGWGRGIRK